MRSIQDRSAGGRDQAWFEDLFRRNHAAVLSYARRRVIDSDAEDVVAEVFTVAWRKREEVPARALPWLYAVAAREVLHHHRSRQRRFALDERAASQPQVPGGDAYALVDDRMSIDPPLRRALGRLCEDDAEILRLWAWEQLEPVEIASVLGVSAAATRVRLHRARRRLEAMLRAQAHLPATPQGQVGAPLAIPAPASNRGALS